jgi:hypothetical protein
MRLTTMRSWSGRNVMMFLLFPVDRLVFETMPPGAAVPAGLKGPALASATDLWSDFSGFKGAGSTFLQ